MGSQPQYCIGKKDYLGTRSFPRTTDVTNSLEYSIASTLGKEERKKINEFNCATRMKSKQVIKRTKQTFP